MSESPNRKPLSPTLTSSYGSSSTPSSPTSSSTSPTTISLNGSTSSNSSGIKTSSTSSQGGTIGGSSGVNSTMVKSVSANAGLSKSTTGVLKGTTTQTSTSSPSLSSSFGCQTTTTTTTSSTGTLTTISSPPPTSYSKKNVEYILLAEFDIDIGSKVKYQYPCPTGEDEALLAEFMLPDGAHNRESDWTVFFLNRPDPDGILSKNKKTKPKPKTQEKMICTIEAFIYKFSEEQESKGWVMLDNEKLLLQVFPNHINVVGKNNSVFTKIEKHPDLEHTQLEPLFDCVLTDSGTALGVRFSEGSDEELFLSHVNRMIKEMSEEKILAANMADMKLNGDGAEKSSTTTNTNNDNETTSPTTTSSPTSSSSQFLYCLNYMNNQKDESVRRGAVVKSLAICTTHPFIHIYKPFMILGIQKYYSSPSLEVIIELYNSLNSLDMTTVPFLNDVQKHILRSSPDKNKQSHSTNITYLGKQMPVYIPITLFPDEVGDYKVITLVQKFGNDVMKIFNGILSQKRILFLGYGCSAGDVCNYVLAASCMVCPPLKGIRERIFPYTNLVYLDFLEVPGYITGVTNPMFEEKTDWWDILCNIQTGKVVMNPALVSEVPDKFAQYDSDFMAEVNYNISAHYGEDKIKSLFQEYTQHIVDMALDEEEFLDDQSRQLALDANKPRIDAWTKTKTYSTYLQDRENSKKNSAIRDHTIQQSIKKLRKRKHVPEKEVLKIYDSFLNSIKTEQQVTEFLSYLPKSHGGLFPVAVGLFHQSKDVRNATCEILKRLDKIQTGSGFISGLNPFLKQSYERNLKYQNI